MMKLLPLIPREARHEARLILAVNPVLFSLLTLGRVAGSVRKVPRLGWIITDPVVARRLLSDSAHASLLGEGGVGHLWAQLLGDRVKRPWRVVRRRASRNVIIPTYAQLAITCASKEGRDES
jgi:hypothetical protein